MLYNDGYTIRGVQKVIKENGTKQLLNKNDIRKSFTEENISNNEQSNDTLISQHSLTDTKEKLMNVMNDLVQLRKKLDQE